VRRITRFLDQRVEGIGFSAAQLGLLAQIAVAADDTLGALALRTGLDQSTLSRNLRTLENNGLIEIATVENDLRRRAVWLTESGARRLEAAAKFNAVQAKVIAEAPSGPDGQPGRVLGIHLVGSRVGELIAESRRRFVESLLPYWRESVLALSGLEPELHYFKGWAQDVSLAEALVASKARDESKRLTHPGPHRADVIVRMNGRPAREVLSRGQQKLVAVAMTLAQLNLLQEATQTTPTLLLDDPAAELDGDHLRRFIEQVMRLQSQLVLTSLHSESHLFGTPNRVFHVEQGRVQPV